MQDNDNETRGRKSYKEKFKDNHTRGIINTPYYDENDLVEFEYAHVDYFRNIIELFHNYHCEYVLMVFKKDRVVLYSENECDKQLLAIRINCEGVIRYYCARDEIRIGLAISSEISTILNNPYRSLCIRYSKETENTSCNFILTPGNCPNHKVRYPLSVYDLHNINIDRVTNVANNPLVYTVVLEKITLNAIQHWFKINKDINIIFEKNVDDNKFIISCPFSESKSGIPDAEYIIDNLNDKIHTDNMRNNGVLVLRKKIFIKNIQPFVNNKLVRLRMQILFYKNGEVRFVIKIDKILVQVILMSKNQCEDEMDTGSEVAMDIDPGPQMETDTELF